MRRQGSPRGRGSLEGKEGRNEAGRRNLEKRGVGDQRPGREKQWSFEPMDGADISGSHLSGGRVRQKWEGIAARRRRLSPKTRTGN